MTTLTTTLVVLLVGLIFVFIALFTAIVHIYKNETQAKAKAIKASINDELNHLVKRLEKDGLKVESIDNSGTYWINSFIIMKRVNGMYSLAWGANSHVENLDEVQVRRRISYIVGRFQ